MANRYGPRACDRAAMNDTRRVWRLLLMCARKRAQARADDYNWILMKGMDPERALSQSDVDQLNVYLFGVESVPMGRLEALATGLRIGINPGRGAAALDLAGPGPDPLAGIGGRC